MSRVAAARAFGAVATPQSTDDFFLTEAHSRSIAERVIAALRDERTLVVVTGDPPPRGPALAPVMEAAAHGRYRVIAITCDEEFDPDMLLQRACGLSEAAVDVAALSRARQAPLFLLSEAERLSDAQIGGIALFADLAIAAVVLLAAPGFRERLEAPPLLSVKERLAAAFSLQELGCDEIEAFIRHQFGSGVIEGAFPGEAIAAIAEAAGGDPRLVNRLARYVLSHADSSPLTLFAGALDGGEKRAAVKRALVPVRAAAGEEAPADRVAMRRLSIGALGLAFLAGAATSGAAILLGGARHPQAARPQIEARARPSLSAAEIALLLQRGDRFLATGDIASARLFYEPAASAGNGHAALRLAETYDPAFLRRAGVRGIPGNLRLARKWYRRARALGSAAVAPGG